MIQKDAIKKFGILYERRFGEKLSDDEMLHKANKLLNLYRAIYGSATLEQIEKTENTNGKK